MGDNLKVLQESPMNHIPGKRMKATTHYKFQTQSLKRLLDLNSKLLVPNCESGNSSPNYSVLVTIVSTTVIFQNLGITERLP